jgi:hypothetical protein
MRIKSLIAGITLFTALAGTTFAKDHTLSNGRLSNDQFYRAVSCLAPIDKPCQSQRLRWPTDISKKLTVGLVQVQKGTTALQEQTVRDAIKEAVEIINDAGANVKLHYITGFRAKRTTIRVHIVTPQGPKYLIAGTRFKDLNGLTAQNARTVILGGNGKILRTGVTISNTLKNPTQIRAIVLEELVQSLGLMWDIDNPYYNDTSIFSQFGPDNLMKIEGQDKAALQRHYPF